MKKYFLLLIVWMNITLAMEQLSREEETLAKQLAVYMQLAHGNIKESNHEVIQGSAAACYAFIRFPSDLDTLHGEINKSDHPLVIRKVAEGLFLKALRQKRKPKKKKK